ncbi:MAG: type IX secretion system membrane protein PorP/SprF [Chlorobi bacterium]|nr:type IX secretion system membrane protein PorP/SprF [Chlorobiota bacterium]
MLNRKVIRSIIVIFLLAGWGISSSAQDPQFSQFYANPLYLNPALAGNAQCGRAILNYRNQWPALSKAYITYNASYDMSIPKINSGVGILAMSDRQGSGALIRNAISAFYSYKLKVSEPILISFGVEAKYYMEKLDWNKLIFADQIDPTTGNVDPSTNEKPPENDRVSVFDFSAGAILSYYDKWFVGVAAHHLTQPNLSFYNNGDSKLPLRFTVHGGISVNLSEGGLGNQNTEDFIISPQLLYMQQENFKQLNAGLYFSKSILVVGAWFRHNFSNPDAAIAMVGLQFSNIKVGYSYDFTISNIGGSSGGAHEVSFAWNFCLYKQEKRMRIRAIKSPSF